MSAQRGDPARGHMGASRPGKKIARSRPRRPRSDAAVQSREGAPSAAQPRCAAGADGGGTAWRGGPAGAGRGRGGSLAPSAERLRNAPRFVASKPWRTRRQGRVRKPMPGARGAPIRCRSHRAEAAYWGAPGMGRVRNAERAHTSRAERGCPRGAGRRGNEHGEAQRPKVAKGKRPVRRLRVSGGGGPCAAAQSAAQTSSCNATARTPPSGAPRSGVVADAVAVAGRT